MREEVVRELVYRFMTEPDYLDRFRTDEGRSRVIRGYELTQDELDALSGMAPAEMGLGRLEARVSASAFVPTAASGACECMCGNDSAYCKKKNCPAPPPPSK